MIRIPGCLEPDGNRFERVGTGLPGPPYSPVEATARYGWPAFDNLITFSLPAGWDAGGGELGGLHRHRENAEPGTSVEVSFGRLIEGAAGPDHDGTPVTIAGYDGWLRRDSTSPDGGRLREFVLELDKERWWLVIYLQTGPRAPADDIADVMRLLASIRPAQGD